MKRSLILAFGVFVVLFTRAQYCGFSGPQVCDAVYFPVDTNSFTNKSFDSLPCLVRGVPYNESITIRTDSCYLIFGSQALLFRFNSFEMDSIWNLPQGICWNTNVSNNKVTNGGWFCLNFSGITNVPAGFYDAYLLVSVSLNVSMYPEDGPEPKLFRLRVIEPGASCENLTGIAEETTVDAMIRLISDKIIIDETHSVGNALVYDALGRLVKSIPINSAEQTQIDVSDLDGLFFVTVQGENNATTKKFFKPAAK